MAVDLIDVISLKTMFLAGARNLENNKEWINDLNVFPVPDGDTGTNMTLTVTSAVREVEKPDQVTMPALAKAISSGSLRGARGNSGVIMSQLFRGFTREMQNYESIDKETLTRAMERASETAYKAVMKPKEGTILTVARGMAEKAREIVGDDSLDIVTFAEAIIAHGDYVLSTTPDLLPVLKEAGVVDSGGQGLMQFLKGAFAGLTGREIAEPVRTETAEEAMDFANFDVFDSIDDIKFAYCTEFIVNIEKPYDENEERIFKAYLEGIGDCVVVVSDDEIIKIHVHTNDPGLALQKGLTYGSLTRMKIDNMREEFLEKQAEADSAAAAEPAERKPFGFITISAGDGLKAIFESLNVDCVISGGQTMNPSTEDILEAIDKINADTIYVLPNNKNIILAAQQASQLTKDKQIVVVPSKTVPQGITALVTFLPEASAEDNLAAMTEAMETVKTGQITYAVRDTAIDGVQIHTNDLMGIGDHSALLSVGQDLETVALDMVGAMVDDEATVISVYSGEGVDSDTAQALADKLEELYPDMDVELNEGGQPIYYYIISVE